MAVKRNVEVKTRCEVGLSNFLDVTRKYLISSQCCCAHILGHGGKVQEGSAGRGAVENKQTTWRSQRSDILPEISSEKSTANSRSRFGNKCGRQMKLSGYRSSLTRWQCGDCDVQEKGQPAAAEDDRLWAG
ncbi:Hypothetical protein SMAX5B_004228 [Scophthalmus maximus]|uniref:Uncharacterized protein n=1 Tax=Scophthalmus maximus TaxID=52904 RepID=A0A2U9B8R7_SCOMX|nr:Hypothetical protein SMAX5B_004228 [Scophthalmus maximus]